MPTAMHPGLKSLREPLLGLSGAKNGVRWLMPLDCPDFSRVLPSPPWHHTCTAQQQKQLTHLEAAGLVGSACGVRDVQSGTGQAARSWRPILPFEVEEDAGIRLCWSHSCFHGNSPHIPRDRPPVGLSDPGRDHLEKNEAAQLQGGVERRTTQQPGTGCQASNLGVAGD